MGTALHTLADHRRAPKTRRFARARNAVHDFGPAFALAAVILIVVQFAMPASASAIDLNPIHWAKSIAGDVTDIGTGIFVRGFVAILNSLFAGIEAKLTLDILTWLTSLDNQTGGQITGLYHLTSGIALGLLAAVLSVSIARYWISGLSMSGSGGFEAVEALLRTLLAVGLLLVWPFFFGQLVALSNIISGTVLGSPALRAQIAHIINTVVFVAGFAPSGAVSIFVAIVVAVAGALLFLALLFMKVMIGAAVTFLYVAMPLAIIVWPVPELSWLARYAARAFLSLLIIPIVWALIFATFAAVSVNAIEFTGANGFVNQITQPLVALAMLLMTITIPRTLFKMAASPLGMGRHGGGFVARAGSYVAARQAQQFLTQQGLLPSGGKGTAPTTPGGGGRGATTPSPAPSPAPTGGPAGPTIVTVPVATGGAPAAGTAVGNAHNQANAAFRSPGGVMIPTRGNDPATGPSVGAHRPRLEHPNPVDARPPTNAANLRVLDAAMDESRRSELPSEESTRQSLDRLGPAVQEHLRDAYEHGGPRAAQAEAATLATSDRISNRQSADLMRVASAASHNTLGPLLGGAKGDPGSFTSPSDRSLSPSASGGPLTPPPTPKLQAPPPATPPPPHTAQPEHSPDRSVRDDAWTRSRDGEDPR